MAKEPTELAEVIETMPNLLYKIRLQDGRELIAHMSGKMKLNKIHVLVGDKVDVVVDKFGGKTSNRIVLRRKMN